MVARNHAPLLGGERGGFDRVILKDCSTGFQQMEADCFRRSRWARLLLSLWERVSGKDIQPLSLHELSTPRRSAF